MKIETFKQKMYEAGDAYVYYVSPVSNKQKYHICTLELDNNQYINNKLAQRPSMASPKDGSIRAFCWDLDDFKNIEVSTVTSIVPLSAMLNRTYR
jgi:hypothetical protein